MIGNDSALANQNRIHDHVRRLFRLSESRGKEAAGLAVANQRELVIYKQPLPATRFIDTPTFGDVLDSAFTSQLGQLGQLGQASSAAFIGHSRLVTDGVRDIHFNNQPVQTSGIVGIHNGIIVNHQALWDAHSDLERQYEIDSEIIFVLLRRHLDAGAGIEAAAASTFEQIQGAASIACLFEDHDALLLATNNGSQYYRTADHGRAFVFTSEEYILRQFVKQSRLGRALPPGPAIPVRPGEGVLVDLRTLRAHHFRLGSASQVPVAAREPRRQTVDRSPLDTTAARAAHVRRADFVDFDAIAKRFPYRPTTHTLTRCARCILPETMPFIEFDDHGVCNYCRNHRIGELHGRDALERLVKPHRKRNSPDCVVACSGGRDSLYGLHYVKTVLGMNPIAYTYDWGMVTDLARRNVSRICGKLGVEHILVSADIVAKRENVRKNVEAWLARPTLGTIPLFMAGDKAYFYFLGKVCEQIGTDLAFLCENLLERSDFKVGYAGIKPQVVDEDHTYTLGLKSKADLIAYYLEEFARNRRYLNRSLVDTAKAFAFFYIQKRRDHNLFRYIPWIEEEVVSTIRGEYDFELSPDTTTTWRIGDGTAAFYNYIYHSVAGFTENDTFRSNQIRAGVMDRDEALRLVEIENRPRFESVKWYLDTIGIDRSLSDVLELIGRIPKRGAHASSSGRPAAEPVARDSDSEQDLQQRAI